MITDAQALRGDLVTVHFGAAERPALVIQSDVFWAHQTVTVLPLTNNLRVAPMFRIPVEPTPENGLNELSQIMVDSPQTIPRPRIGNVIGSVGDETLLAVNQALAAFPGLA